MRKSCILGSVVDFLNGGRLGSFAIVFPHLVDFSKQLLFMQRVLNMYSNIVSGSLVDFAEKFHGKFCNLSQVLASVFFHTSSLMKVGGLHLD